MKRLLIIFVTAAVAAFTCPAQTLQEADSLHQRGRFLAEEGKIAEARICDMQAMEIRKSLLGEVSEDYITSLNNYAVTFMMEEDYAKAAELQDRVMDLCSRLSEQHPKLSLFSRNAGYVNYMLGNHEKAIKYWEIALPLVEKFSKEYEGVLSGLALMYEETGNKEGKNRTMALMEEHNRHELTLPCDQPDCMIERASYYGATGNHAIAKECYAKALAMPMDPQTRITVYEAYAQYMASTLRDWSTGAEYQHKAATLRKETDGEDENYARSMNNAGLFYYLTQTDEGQRKAIDCLENARNAYQQLGNAAQIAKCCQLEGNCYQAGHDYTNAKKSYLEALAYYEANDRDSNDYPKMIERVASSEKFNKEYEAAITHYQQALQLFEQRGMITEYADAQTGLSNCYRYAGITVPDGEMQKYEQAVKDAQIAQLDQTIAEEKEDLDLTKDYFGKMMFAHSLGTIAGCNAMKEDYDEAVEYYRQYMEAIRDAVRDEFRLQSETERMDTWKGEELNILDIMDMVANLPESHRHLAPDVAALAYDAQLLSKGILLNSSIEFEKVFNALNDKNLSDIYQKIKANRQEIERLRAEADSDADLERILTLTQENLQLQVELNKGCREMEDYTRYISYDWHDVQSVLTDRDVSIEFASINPSSFGDNAQMVALVLTKDSHMPIALQLWNDNEIMAQYASDPLYRAIGDTIMLTTVQHNDIKEAIQRLKDTVSVSDSPYKSELYLYLNYLEHQADTTTTTFFFVPLMAPTYSELIRQDDVVYEGADAGNLVWGALSPYLEGKDRIFFSADGLFNNIGIEYLQYNGRPLSEQFEVYRLSSTKELCYKHDADGPTKAALFGDINYNGEATSSDSTQKSLAALRGAGQADSYADLSNTLREVNDIRNILKDSGVNDTETFRDTEASKKAFLGLSDSRVDLLHIATHGMFRNSDRATDAESMLNSILAFAGANLDDDALVTAAEIAGMNLRDCDLAVLSACETGLGKQGNDGVFGLQRGFKNAGVHTLLMSLKNVYDDSTADLMISFYKYLMEGASKREALVKAQQDIRAKGFTDPKYWATFILLDAI